MAATEVRKIFCRPLHLTSPAHKILKGADSDERAMEQGPISEADALALMAYNDKQRKTYHNQFCRGKWGDARNWDLAINSARLGISGTADFLEQYIRTRMEQQHILLRD